MGRERDEGTSLLIEPHVLKPPAVENAVDDQVEALDARPPAGRGAGVEDDRPRGVAHQAPLDLPYQLPPLLGIGLARLTVDQRVNDQVPSDDCPRRNSAEGAGPKSSSAKLKDRSNGAPRHECPQATALLPLFVIGIDCQQQRTAHDKQLHNYRQRTTCERSQASQLSVSLW